MPPCRPSFSFGASSPVLYYAVFLFSHRNWRRNSRTIAPTSFVAVFIRVSADKSAWITSLSEVVSSAPPQHQ
eukprot:12881011-Prorocentrum_lima.AAC.1